MVGSCLVVCVIVVCCLLRGVLCVFYLLFVCRSLSFVGCLAMRFVICVSLVVCRLLVVVCCVP